MTRKPKHVSARLDVNLADWWQKRKEAKQLSDSELLRELIISRMAFEKDAWGELGRFVKQQKAEVTQT